MARSTPKAALLGTIKEASDVFRYCSKRLKILSALSWGAPVAREFFKKKEGALPNPSYSIDVDTISTIVKELIALAPKLKGDHPVLQWLSLTQESFLLGARLLLEVGNERFYEIASQLYGNSKSKVLDGTTSNIELANSISTRISVCNLNDISESIVLKSAEDFAADLERKLKARRPALPVRIEFSEEIAAKVVAGMYRVRVRSNARFSELDVTALWNHEIESHCLTANNGILQESCDFMGAGGPRTTMTQEGLAVFFEMYGHSMSQRRFLALCDRVHAIELVENGANFLDLYRWYRERSDSEMEAFLAASRIFRGAKLEGGGPFTKDVVYLAGLLAIYNFLRIAVKNQNRLLVESLVCGRIAVEDVATISWMRSHGILSPPRYVPEWLGNWEALLSSFSFSAFLNSVDLSRFQSYFDNMNSLQDWDFSL